MDVGSLSSGSDPFGHNTAILFVALASYLVVAGNAWIGYLLMVAAALMWVGTTKEPAKAIPQHDKFAANFGA